MRKLADHVLMARVISRLFSIGLRLEAKKWGTAFVSPATAARLAA